MGSRADTEAIDTSTVADAGTADSAPSQPEVIPAEPAASSVAAPAGDVVEDLVPVAAVMVPILDEDDMPLTWDPVPVPRPTYTMKAKAERPEVPPAAVTADPVPVMRERQADDEAYDQRRVAGA